MAASGKRPATTVSPLAATPTFLPGEKVQLTVLDALAIGSDTGKQLFEGGSMWITNFRIYYRLYVRLVIFRVRDRESENHRVREWSVISFINSRFFVVMLLLSL